MQNIDMRFLLCVVSLMLAMECAAAFQEEKPRHHVAITDDHPTYDCGSLSLYNFLRLESIPADLSAIERHLPEATEQGRSFYDLTQVARKFGLELQGVRLIDPNEVPRQTALAHLQQEDHGHFVVLRPVGHSGRLFQVIDGLAPPSVIDIDEIRQSESWTGLLLVQKNGGVWALAKRLGFAAVLGILVFQIVKVVPRRILGRG